MSSSSPARRLTTVLFIDIVGSTKIASQLGDARWHTLLAAFRKEVRAEVRSHKGREENFTGDGILATFPQPERAIEAAMSIALGVQRLGLDIRAGIHTGQVEVIDGQLGGVAVHIGARVLALADDAQILVTRTTMDLVHGSSVTFGESQTHELKGVSNEWGLAPVVSCGDRPAPTPIDPDVAAQRLETVEAAKPEGRRRLVIGLVAAALVVLVAGTVFLMKRSSGPTSPLSLMKLDAGGDPTGQQVQDGMLTDHLWAALSVQNGTLYQRTPTKLRIRDLQSGAVEGTPIDIDPNEASTIGFGSEWVAHDEDIGSIQRVDLVSGEEVASLDVKGGALRIAVGPDAIWFTTRTGDLGRIDPITQNIETWPSDAVSPGAVVPFADYVWICDCENKQIFRFDTTTHEFKRFDIPESAYLIGPTDGSSPAQLWLIDQAAGAITPLDPKTGEQGRPHGFAGVIADAQIGLGKIWIAAADHVYVLDATDEEGDTVDVPMPAGFFASSIGIDTQAKTVWVGTCGCPLDE